MLPFWKLVGFVLYVALYMFACDGLNSWPEESLRSVVIKVLPVLQCLLIVLSSKSDQPGYASYKESVALGLVLSMCGDGLLVYAKYRELGGACFALAHVLYCRALGMKPLGGGPTMLSFLVLWASATYYLLPGLKEAELIGVPGYLLLLHIMTSRATVRYQVAPSLVNFLACLGAILFVASDIVLMSEFFIANRPMTPVVVMGTYYLAQLGIALSATDDFTPTAYDAKTKSD